MDKDKKNYLHKLVDMTTHYLVRRYTGNLLHFPKGKKFMGTIYGCLSIRPDVRTNFLLSFTSHLLLLDRKSVV